MTLPSSSPGAHDTEIVYVVVSILAIVVIAIVNLAILRAVATRRAGRDLEPSPEPVTGRGQRRAAELAALVAIAVIVVGVVYTQMVREVAPSRADGLAATIGKSAKPLRIQVVGRQWLWRYTYPNCVFDYYELTVPVDTAVQLDIYSQDVRHSWWIPALGGKADAIPGRVNHVRFRADRTGIYKGQSAAYSGASFAAMRAAVRVVSAPQYATWLAAKKKQIARAQGVVQAFDNRTTGGGAAPVASEPPGGPGGGGTTTGCPVGIGPGGGKSS